MYNNLVINNIQEPILEVSRKPLQTEAKADKPKAKKDGDTSKVEKAYKTYFRKYIDGQINNFAGVPLKRSNITLIGPPPGSQIDDQKKTELIYQEAEAILAAYIKEIFGENKTYYQEVASKASDIKDLIKSRNLLQRVLDNITKKLAKSKQTKIDTQATGIADVSKSTAGFYTDIPTPVKKPAPDDLYDNDGAIDQTERGKYRIPTGILNNNPALRNKEDLERAAAMKANPTSNIYVIYDKESPTGYSRVVNNPDGTINKIPSTKEEFYATSHIGVDNEEDISLQNEYKKISSQIENINSKISAKNRENEAISKIVDPSIDKYVLRVFNIGNDETWPNEQKRPPESTPEESVLQQYHNAIASKNFEQIKIAYAHLEQNVAPIFADYFGLAELYLNQQTFPKIQIMNLIISRIIQKLHEEVKKSDLVKRELLLLSIGEDGVTKPEDIFTTEGGSSERLNRTLKSISENEIMAFRKLFAENKYEALGASLSDAENVMFSAIQKNLNAIHIFLTQNKPTILSLVNSIRGKIIKFSHGNVFNKYEKEFEDIGLEDALDSQSSLIVKKWRERFSKIPPESRPFKEIFSFIKLVDTKFKEQTNINKDDFILTAKEIKSTFFNPVMFFLTLVDNASLIESNELDEETLLKSDWGNNFRDYMGAQKISHTSPRDDLVVLMNIGRFMREGLTNVSLEDPTSELGKRLQQASETIPKNVAKDKTQQLISGDRNVLINTREFLNKLKEGLPSTYSQLIFAELGRLRKEIVGKKSSKEFEAAAQLYNGPYQKAKENIISILSPILREFLSERYALDTRLFETTKLFYKTLKQFGKLIEKFDPNTGEDVEKYLWSGLEDFNRTKIVQAMQGGPKRLWHIPQDNEGILALMDSLLDSCDIRKMHKKESYHRVSELAIKPLTPEFHSNKASLSSKKYLDQDAYEKEKLRAIKIRGKYYVLDVCEKDVTFYTIEPKDSIVRNPDEALKLIEKLWKNLERIFKQKLSRLGFNNKLLSNEPDSTDPVDYYSDQFEKALGMLSTSSLLKKKGKSVPHKMKIAPDAIEGNTIKEPIASDDKDKQNQYKHSEVPTVSLAEKDNQIMELLAIASILFDAVNIDEKMFMNRVNNNIFDTLDVTSNVKGTIKTIVSSLFNRDWNEVHSLLFKPIGKESNKEGSWISAKQISPEERSSTKSPLLIIISTIIATCIDLVEQSSKLFKETHGKKIAESEIFTRLGVDGIYSAYSRTIDSLKELLQSAFLSRIGKVRPQRSIPKDRGSFEKGSWNIISQNVDETTSIRHPFTLHNKWRKLGDAALGLSGMDQTQNQDPTSDTRQQAMLAAQNAINRFMYALQQYRKKEKGEQVEPNEGFAVNTSDILTSLGNSIDAEIKSSFKDLYRSRKFGNTSWKNRDLDNYHAKIIKELRTTIENFGYDPNKPQWFLQNDSLKAKAIEIVADDIKEHFLQGIETGKALGAPGDKEKSGVSGPANPLHRSGKNPSSRLLGNNAPGYVPDELENTEFAGNTAIDKLTIQQKQSDAEKRLQQWIEIYPQFLEEKGNMNISMFEPTSIDGDQTLEDKIGVAGQSEDSKTLNIAVHEFDNVLDDCFSPIGQKISSKNEKGIPKFIYSYKHLKEDETKILNNYILDLGQKIEASPLESRYFFKTTLSLIPSEEEQERNKFFKEVIFMKYFEYVYTREVLLSETILYLMRIENERKGPSDKKIESITEYIQQSNLNIRNIPGVEYKFYKTDDISQREKLSRILEYIFGDNRQIPQFLEIARDLESYITGRTDLDSGDDDVQTFGMSKKSDARTDVHGVEATKQGKQEKTRVSAIDKQMFNLLNIQNISKIMSKVLTSDKEVTYSGNISYDKLRSYIRNLVSIYNEPMSTESTADRVMWFVSYVKDNLFRVRDFLYSAANAQALSKMSPFERKELFTAIDNVLNSASYKANKIIKFKQNIYKLIHLMYAAPLGEEEDYGDFDITSALDKIKEITKAIQIAVKTDQSAFVSPYTKELAELLNSFGKMVQSGAVEASDKTTSYLTDKGGLILTIMDHLKTKGKQPVDPARFNNLTNMLDQLLNQLKELAKLNSKPKERYQDPNKDKVLPQDKGYSGTVGRTTKEPITPEDQAIIQKLQGKKVTKESKDFEPFKEAIAVEKILKCIKMQSAGIQRVKYSEYSKEHPGKLSRVLFELSRQLPIDLDNYRVYLTEENKSKVNIVFEYKDENRGLTPEYIWVVPKRSISSN